MKRATQLTFGSWRRLWPWMCIYIVTLSVQLEVHDQGVFEFGNPVIFVTTKDQDFDPYRRIEKIQNTFMENEYMLYKSHPNEKTVLRMVMYDPANTKDVIQQNWGKEQYWAFVNSTGVLPSMTISNTTTKATSTFYTEANNNVQFYADLKSTFSTKDTVPPIDVLFEIPAESKSFRQRKTLIDYSSWAVLKWKWGTSHKWTEIRENYQTRRVGGDDFELVATPCLPDLFILYVVLVPIIPSPLTHIFLNIPPITLNDVSLDFWDITDALCPDLDSFEECVRVGNIILTNKYMIVLNGVGVSISKDLTSSTEEPFSDKLSLMSFTTVDPCAGFTSKLGVKAGCFKDPDITRKLFYTPICSLYQVPNYDDIVIMSIQIKIPNTDPSGGTGAVGVVDEYKFSVFFSYSPYTKWLPLFLNEMKYNGKTIKEIVGIIFNHQLRHFDITVLLEDKIIVNGEEENREHATRFVLPIPKDLTIGHAKISDTPKTGFIDFSFPSTFIATEVTMNPVTMDILFLGKQLWIAESAGPIVYLSIGSVPDDGEISKCRFNHPDRFFVCTVVQRRRTPVNELSYSDIFVGRTAHQYSLVNIKTKDITEISQFVGRNGLLWPPAYVIDIQKTAIFTVSFSGNILFWYLFDPEEFARLKLQTRVICELLSLDGTKLDLVSSNLDEDTYEFCLEVWKEIRKAKALGIPWEPKVAEDKTIPHFRMMSLNPLKFDLATKPTYGPLTPFFIDSTNAILYEVSVPATQDETVEYISAVNIGQRIQCPRKLVPGARPLKTHEKYDCDMYVRHIKNVEKYLPGFRQALYVSISKSIPMKAIQDKLTIEFEKNSNFVTVTLLPEKVGEPTKMNFSDGTATAENYAIIGQSIYVPGKFSILIKGFPNMAISRTGPEDKIRQTSVWGYATLSVTKERKEEIGAYDSWLIDLSTCEYRKARSKGLELKKNDPYFNFPSDAYERYNVYLDRKRYVYIMNKEYARQRKVKEEINRERGWIGLGDLFIGDQLKRPTDLAPIPYTSFTVTGTGITNTYDPFICAYPPGIDGYVHKPWVTGDGGCHHIMILQDNPVLKGHGGRLSLDRLDSVSFVVTILPISQIGNLMLYRPMIVVTNSNPEVLTVDRIFTRGAGYQTMKVNMRPTGVRTGVSTVSIRSIVASIDCETPSSMTFVVSAHREEGRRLHVNYPHPICNNKVAYQRPWHQDPPKCITIEEIADPEIPVIKRDGEVVFSTLPKNYRPPSVHGAAIPMSENVYNADPSAPMFNEYYTISKTSRKYDDNFCANKPSRDKCNCQESDKIQEDPIYSDCKEMVYTSKRGVDIPISIEYDPIMRDEDQLADFRTKRTDLYVYIKEINGRVEFSVMDAYSDCVSGDVDESSGIVKCNEVLKEINNATHLHLNEGNKFLDAKSLKFILYGTGLFHFKVGLGKFDTFDEVTGYFTLFSASEDLNDVKLMVVMFLTLSFCFVLLFCGFLHVRKRLTAHLPYNDERPNDTGEDGQGQAQGQAQGQGNSNSANNPQTGNNPNNPDETGRGTKRKNTEEAGKGKKVKEEPGKGTAPKNTEDAGKVKVE